MLSKSSSKNRCLARSGSVGAFCDRSALSYSRLGLSNRDNRKAKSPGKFSDQRSRPGIRRHIQTEQTAKLLRSMASSSFRSSKRMASASIERENISCFGRSPCHKTLKMPLHIKLQFILILEFTLIFSVLGQLADSQNLKGVLLLLHFFSVGLIYVFVQRIR
jgi:hypothetical protein